MELFSFKSQSRAQSAPAPLKAPHDSTWLISNYHGFCSYHEYQGHCGYHDYHGYCGYHVYRCIFLPPTLDSFIFFVSLCCRLFLLNNLPPLSLPSFIRPPNISHTFQKQTDFTKWFLETKRKRQDKTILKCLVHFPSPLLLQLRVAVGFARADTQPRRNANSRRMLRYSEAKRRTSVKMQLIVKNYQGMQMIKKKRYRDWYWYQRYRIRRDEVEQVE